MWVRMNFIHSLSNPMNRFNHSVVRRAATISMLWIFAGLAGCTINPVAVDSAVLKPKQGLLVMQIKSNAYAKLTFVDYDANYSFSDRMKHDLVTGYKGYVTSDDRHKKYIVMPIDAGDYMWETFTSHPKTAYLDRTNKFKIVANSITYIGQLDIFVADMRYSLKVSDQVDDMRKYLGENFPGYLKSMPVVTNLADMHL